ncbi:HalOD1 output domain-containing protein [Halomarina rubra]|uniref:HalOD1 output domain-containing protein n=1 Tax=Halomarina rubra TaxID=2071873 RepID=A0ABD6B0Y1_9EURY|nr:HalOD1 output domain-containing protein [Halomarina rubra]
MGFHEASYDGSDPIYTAVVEAVAETKGVDPLSLEPPLYDVLDPEALDSLYSSPTRTETPLRVSFSYADCTVTVDSDGQILIES